MYASAYVSKLYTIWEMCSWSGMHMHRELESYGEIVVIVVIILLHQDDDPFTVSGCIFRTS